MLCVISIFLVKSGYGSEAVSSSNLTNDDVASLRSMSVETPDMDRCLGSVKETMTNGETHSADEESAGENTAPNALPPGKVLATV